MTTNQLIKCEWCKSEFSRASNRGPKPKYCRASHRQRAHERAKHHAFKRLGKQNRRLQERLNRIAKFVPGRGRLNVFDRLVMDLRVHAIEIEETPGHDDLPAMKQVALMKQAAQYRKDALFLQRFEWDMRRLRDTVRDEPRREARINYTTGKYDHDNWEGPRP